MSTEVYFDQPCANCPHRRGSHEEWRDSHSVTHTACMVRGCGCTAWRAA